MLVSGLSIAETITATCYSPKGKRIDYINDKFEEDDDGYSNSNPTFFFSSNEPNILIESWQSALLFPELMSREKVDEIIPPSVIKSSVVSYTKNILHAVSMQGKEAYSTTLYIKDGIGIFTRVQISEGGFTDAMGAVYSAKCSFNILE